MKRYILKSLFIVAMINIFALSQSVYGSNERIIKHAYNDLPGFTLDYATNSIPQRPRFQVCVTEGDVEICAGCRVQTQWINCWYKQCNGDDCTTNSCNYDNGKVGCQSD